MNISFKELRKIKHEMPSGSVSRIAKELDINEQTVRNYFGANKFEEGSLTGKHLQPGPNGGVVSLQDTTILNLAKQIIKEAKLGI
ncbi:MAG: DNA-binding protein [Bacteroidota bacterium]